MLYNSFGTGKDQNAWRGIAQVIEKLQVRGVKALGSIEAQLVLNEHYCDFYNITDLDDPTRPWASVADNDVEGLRDLWGISRRRAEFKIYEIHSNYGYNFTEFINLPRWFVEDILQDRRDEERKLRVARESAANKQKQENRADGLPADDLRGYKP